MFMVFAFFMRFMMHCFLVWYLVILPFIEGQGPLHYPKDLWYSCWDLNVPFIIPALSWPPMPRHLGMSNDVPHRFSNSGPLSCQCDGGKSCFRTKHKGGCEWIIYDDTGFLYINSFYARSISTVYVHFWLLPCSDCHLQCWTKVVTIQPDDPVLKTSSTHPLYMSSVTAANVIDGILQNHRRCIRAAFITCEGDSTRN